MPLRRDNIRLSPATLVCAQDDPTSRLSTTGASGGHVRNIVTKLGPLSTPDDHRRVLAVLTYLRSS